MTKIILLSCLFILTLQARQNPFFPSKGEVDIPYTSNSKTALPPLQRAAISVASNARVIKKVTVEYINLDGTTSVKSIKLNNALDWHLPIFISQSMGEIASKQNQVAIVQSGDTVVKKKAKKAQKYRQLLNLGFTKFYQKGKELKITSNDFIIRDFLLTAPHRIVLDFQNNLDMKSKVKSFDSRYFKKISFGVHKEYYRIVIELDGHYRYKKERKENGYSLFLY